VIELLRKKGYTLRPVIMQDRRPPGRITIDKIGCRSAFLPLPRRQRIHRAVTGKLYRRRTDARRRWQYADMSNGAYYMIGRVKTHGCFLGQTERRSLTGDSLLYENIPVKY